MIETSNLKKKFCFEISLIKKKNKFIKDKIEKECVNNLLIVSIRINHESKFLSLCQK